jgi:hypothetical protein
LSDIDDPMHVSALVSNDVLDAEVARLQAVIAASGRPKTLAAVAAYEARRARLREVNAQLGTLVARVQSGDLDIAEYLSSLRAAIVKDSKLARALMRWPDRAGTAAGSNKKQARGVVERIKLMKAEVAGAEAAM